MNNLRVDLIIEKSERRSTSPVSLKLVARLVGTLVVIAVVALVGFLVVRARVAKRAASDRKAEWEQLEKQTKSFDALDKQLTANKLVEKEITSWSGARFPWGEFLQKFAAAVPKTVQVTMLKIAGPVDGNERRFKLELTAKVVADNPGGEVLALQNNLSPSGGLSNIVRKIEVGKVDFADVRSGSFPVTLELVSRNYSQ